MNTKLLAVLLAVVASAASPPALAAPCAGFGDVDSTSGFCPNVEWMKNRQVTLGCTSDAYCPGDAVRRDTMAAFLARLGNTLTPRIHVVPPVNIPFHALAGPQFVLCQGTGNFLSTWPLRARGYGIVEAYGDTGPVDLYGRLVESDDEGVTWSDISPIHAVTAADGIDSNVSLRLLLPPRDIAVGARYRYGVAVGRLAGSTTTSGVRELNCTITILFENRNAASPPFDAD